MGFIMAAVFFGTALLLIVPYGLKTKSAWQTLADHMEEQNKKENKND